MVGQAPYLNWSDTSGIEFPIQSPSKPDLHRGALWDHLFPLSVGKSLPTIYHWKVAVSREASESIVPASNFRNRGPSGVGVYQGVGRFGTYDMAGMLKNGYGIRKARANTISSVAPGMNRNLIF
jgi:hypothetical protein